MNTEKLVKKYMKEFKESCHFDGGYGNLGNWSLQIIFERATPKEKIQFEKELAEENPKQWAQFKVIYADLFTKENAK